MIPIMSIREIGEHNFFVPLWAAVTSILASSFVLFVHVTGRRSRASLGSFRATIHVAGSYGILTTYNFLDIFEYYKIVTKKLLNIFIHI